MYAAPLGGTNLTGVCFVCGTPILMGHATSGSSVLAFNANIIGNLDQTGNGDQYPSIDTISIVGSANLTFAIDSALANYFPGLASGNVLTFAAQQTTLNAPFQQADPPACVNGRLDRSSERCDRSERAQSVGRQLELRNGYSDYGSGAGDHDAVRPRPRRRRGCSSPQGAAVSRAQAQDKTARGLRPGLFSGAAPVWWWLQAHLLCQRRLHDCRVNQSC